MIIYLIKFSIGFQLFDISSVYSELFKNNFGIGSASTKILNHIHRNEPDLKFFCIDNDEENLKNSYTRTLLFKDFASIGRALNGENNIVVILPLGGNFGNEMGQYIIRYLINQNKDISVIATTPFTFEGKKDYLLHVRLSEL